jgi:hypothetical protein
MAIQLDHLLVPSRNRVASAKSLAQLLGVPWAESGVGPFSPVYVNDITAAQLPYRSSPHGPVDFKVNTDHGGCIVYWSEPDGHVWEALTVSYARRTK